MLTCIFQFLINCTCYIIHCNNKIQLYGEGAILERIAHSRVCNHFFKLKSIISTMKKSLIDFSGL